VNSTYLHNTTLRTKIRLAFATIVFAVIIGMSYILYDFSRAHQLSHELVTVSQPVTKLLRNINKYLENARYNLQVNLLTGDARYYQKFSDNINAALELLAQLDQQHQEAVGQDEINKLEAIRVTIDEITSHAADINEVSKKYETNYIIVATASSDLNPLALEYLGLLNDMIEELKSDDDLKTNTYLLGLLTDIRYTWTQMMSHLRIALATRNIEDLENVNIFKSQNNELISKLSKALPEIAFYKTDSLKILSERYHNKLEHVITQFDRDIWRLDVFIMTEHIVPAFNELASLINDIDSSQSQQYFTLSNQLDYKLGNAGNTAFIIIIIMLIVSSGLGIALTRYFSKRLLELSVASEKIAEGDLTIRVNPKVKDEIGQFSICFNQMLDSINRYQEELQNAKETAESANEAKTRFLSRMSHELRTPMNAILGFSELTIFNLENQPFEKSETVLENCRQIHVAGLHLLSLLDEILDLSRISQDKVKINMEITEVHSLLKQCIETIRPLLLEKNLSISSSISDATRVRISIDPGRFKQIILNLLSNAVKYNRESGDIHVSCALLADGQFRINITDTGYGFDNENSDNVFEAFNRLDADQKAIDGVGIGLTISKNFVSLMGGRIGAESSPGNGATFWVEFPIVSLSNITKETSYQQLTRPSGPLILYVEDDKSNQLLVEKVFEHHRPDYQLLLASNGNEGISLAKTHHPDLILMDIDLPDINGDEVMLSLKKDGFQDTPFIAVTANVLDSNRDRLIQAGFDRFIAKPIRTKQLLLACDNLLPETTPDQNTLNA